jgi:hypothetical protein
MRFSPRTTLIIACVSVAPAGCAAPAAQTRAVDQAEEFVTALNGRDVDQMIAAAGVPFRYRNQSWQRTADGSAFVLGPANDRTIGDASSLRAFFTDLATKVAVEHTRPETDAPPRAQLLDDQLRGAPGDWGTLDTFLFLRGSGDVAHVAIVGVDPRSAKVTALYVN